MGLSHRLLAGLLSTSLVLAACGGGDGDASGDPPPSSDAEAPAGVDLVLHGGIVRTMDAAGDAEAVAVTGDRIVAVGDADEVLDLADDGTEIVDLDGRALYPGFIDSHSHWYVWGGYWMGLDTPEQVNEVLVKRGWTGTTEMALDANFVEDFLAHHEAGRIVPRVRAYLGLNVASDQETIKYLDWWEEYGLEAGMEVGDRLRIDGLKFFLETNWNKRTHWTADELRAAVGRYHGDGWQLAAHTASDERFDDLLAAYEAIGDPDAIRARRHRVEHLVEVRDDQLPRLQALGLVASVQFAGLAADFHDQPGFDDLIADDGLDAVWPWQDLLAAGVPLAGSIDGVPPDSRLNPISLTPMLMIHGAVTGVSEKGTPPWPERIPQLLSVEQAVRALTIDAAWVHHDDDERGSIEVGKLADFTIFDTDLLGVDDPDEILASSVDATMIGGELVWCGDGLDTWCEAFGQPIPPRLLDEAALVPRPPGSEAADPTPPVEIEIDGDLVRAVRASSSDPDFPASGAVDGETDTGGWLASGDGPHWIELDLGETVPVDALRLWVDQDPEGPTRHIVTAGDAPGPEAVVATLEGTTGWGRMLEAAVGRTVRYLRVTTDRPAEVHGWLEIQVVPG